MKLTLGHDDIIAGICMLLESKGMTAFSPEVVEAKFTQSRKEGTLSVELDTNPAPKTEDAPKAPVAETKPEAAAQQSATKDGEQAAAEAKPNGETQAEVEKAAEPAPEVQTEAPATAAATTEAAAAGGDDDNLFG
jgi:hypothetical protein